jgi:hypothetical protein
LELGTLSLRADDPVFPYVVEKGVTTAAAATAAAPRKPLLDNFFVEILFSSIYLFYNDLVVSIYLR